MAVEKKTVVSTRVRGEDIQLPTELVGKPPVLRIMNELLELGYIALDAGEDARLGAVERFEVRVDALLDKDEAKFLLTDHPAYGVNWIGYIRHLIGPVVRGKERIEPRNHGRGVGDRSGMKQL